MSETSGEVSVTLVLPAYNESSRIVRSLEGIAAYLQSRSEDWEVIIVDDGSTDATGERVTTFTARSAAAKRFRLLRNGINRGKGFSVRRGFLEACGQIVLFSDSDLSSPIDEAEKLLQPIRSGQCDATFGSRGLPESEIRVHQPGFRETGGKIFAMLMRTILRLPFRDTQCGFKAFRRAAFLPVFERQRLERFGFDAEILYVGNKRGLRLCEVPVVWSHCEDTKVHFFSDAIAMSADLCRVRWNDWRGRYE